MRGPKPKTLSLSEAEYNELKALVRRHTTSQQHAFHPSLGGCGSGRSGAAFALRVVWRSTTASWHRPCSGQRAEGAACRRVHEQLDGDTRDEIIALLERLWHEHRFSPVLVTHAPLSRAMPSAWQSWAMARSLSDKGTRLMARWEASGDDAFPVQTSLGLVALRRLPRFSANGR